jgi:hypothetical protein
MIFCFVDIIRHQRRVKIPTSTLNRLDSNHTDLTNDVHLAGNKLISTSTEANTKASTTTCIDLQVVHESEENQFDNSENKRPEMNVNELSTDNKDTVIFHNHHSKSNSLENLSHQPSATKSPTDMTRGVSTRQHVIGYNYDDNSTVGGLYIRIGIGSKLNRKI